MNDIQNDQQSQPTVNIQFREEQATSTKCNDCVKLTSVGFGGFLVITGIIVIFFGISTIGGFFLVIGGVVVVLIVGVISYNAQKDKKYIDLARIQTNQTEVSRTTSINQQADTGQPVYNNQQENVSSSSLTGTRVQVECTTEKPPYPQPIGFTSNPRPQPIGFTSNPQPTNVYSSTLQQGYVSPPSSLAPVPPAASPFAAPSSPTFSNNAIDNPPSYNELFVKRY